MLTLAQLIKITGPDVGKNLAKYTLAGLSRRHKTDDQHRSFTEIKAGIAGGSSVRQAVIHLYGDGVDSPAIVQCSCKFFIHHLEVALAARGSSTLRRSSGEYPRQKNPNLKPGLCPHLVLLTLLVASGDTSRANQALMSKQDQTVAVKISDTLKGLMK